MKKKILLVIVFLLTVMMVIGELEEERSLLHAAPKNNQMVASSKKKTHNSIIYSRKKLKKRILKDLLAMKKSIRLTVNKKALNNPQNLSLNFDHIFDELHAFPKYQAMDPYIKMSGNYYSRGDFYYFQMNVAYKLSKKDFKHLVKSPVISVKTEDELFSVLVKKISNLEKRFTVLFPNHILDIDNHAMLNQFLTRVTDVPSVSDVLKDGIRSSRSKYGDTSILKIDNQYLINKKEKRTMKKFVKNWVKNNLNDEMSEEEKIRAINDYMVKEYRYSFGNDERVTASTRTGREKVGKYSIYSSYALLYEKCGVCDAKAKMFERLAREAGIEVIYVIGKGRGEDHAWNMVKVDGSWYHIDNTWNRGTYYDGSPDQFFNSRDYYLKGDDTFRIHHSWDETKYPGAPEDYPHEVPVALEKMENLDFLIAA